MRAQTRVASARLGRGGAAAVIGRGVRAGACRGHRPSSRALGGGGRRLGAGGHGGRHQARAFSTHLHFQVRLGSRASAAAAREVRASPRPRGPRPSTRSPKVHRRSGATGFRPCALSHPATSSWSCRRRGRAWPLRRGAVQRAERHMSRAEHAAGPVGSGRVALGGGKLVGSATGTRRVMATGEARRMGFPSRRDSAPPAPAGRRRSGARGRSPGLAVRLIGSVAAGELARRGSAMLAPSIDLP
jgi:hypothetical protein